jgi:hypothetical protein
VKVGGVLRVLVNAESEKAGLHRLHTGLVLRLEDLPALRPPGPVQN